MIDLFLVGVIGIAVMIVLLLLGMPVGFTMGVVGLAGVTYILGFDTAIIQLPITFYAIVNNYTLTVLPFFILMGYFAGESGISAELYTLAEKWLRRLPGGLALATIGACAGFASISGSSVATAATMGAVSLPEMRKRHYSDDLAAGSIAAGGTLGFLIPPSVAFVVYGIVAEQSVGRLLVAGFLPGLILVLAFMGIIVARVKINPALAPAVSERVTWGEKLKAVRNVWAVLVVFLLVMGGIYLGFFTPTEAGAMGSFFLLVIGLLRRRVTFPALFRSLAMTAQMSCMIFVIILGAYIFGDFLVLARVPNALVDFVGGLEISRYATLSLLIFLFLLLGCFIESIPLIIIAVPITLPLIESLGFDAVWFGVISILMVEAALITPPVGMNVYVLAGATSNLPVTTIFRGSLPFLLAIVATVIILAIFPDLALMLPNLML